MSHPRYNAFALGNQMSHQEPCGLSGGQMERDPQRGLPQHGSGSSFTSSGSSSGNSGPPGRPIPSLLSLQVNYRPERIETTADEDMERQLDLNISRAREEAMQYSANQSSLFTNVQTDTFPSSDTGKPSFLMSAPTQVGPLTMNSGGSSVDWLPIGQRPLQKESPKTHSPGFSSSFQSSGIQTTGGLSDYGTSLSDQFGTPQEAIQPRYTSESATNILLQFGLQREDLDHLTSYPEDQLTPQNLPFILRQIHLEKVKRTSNPYNNSQAIGSTGELNKLITPKSSVPEPDELTSPGFKSSKVIDYGHTSKSELSSFGPLNKDRGLGQLASKPPKTLPLKKPAPVRQGPSKTQPSKPSSNLIHGVHPGRPGIVLIGNNADGENDDRRRTGVRSTKDPKTRDKKKSNPQRKQHLQHQQPRGPSQRDAMGSSKELPTPAMIQDYAAATPRVFPHTCCLCMKECTSMKDWQYHQNTCLHLENCKKLRERYPVWDGQTPDFLSGPGKDVQHSPSAGQKLQHRHQRSIHETLSRSVSPHRRRGSEDRRERQDRRDRQLSPYRSRSPHLHHASDSRRERRSSRSRSPQTSRHTFRSRSRSYERPTSSRHRSRSRSHERRSLPSRREPQRGHEHRPSPRRSDKRCSSPRRSRERRSSRDGSEPQHKRSRSADRLAKMLLEETAVHSLSNQSDLEAMVKTLAPVLLAELANLESSAAVSSSKTGKKSSSKLTKASSSSVNTRTSSPKKPLFDRSGSPNNVTLSGIFTSLSYTDIFKAMEEIGKVKSVILFRSTKEARVQFEKEEDAKKLQSLQSYKIKGLPLTVCGPRVNASKKPLLQKEQKTAPKKMASKSTSIQSQTSQYHTISKNTSTSKLVTKAKVLVSKAKGMSTKQSAKTVKKSTTAGKSAAVKAAGVKHAASLVPKATTAEKRPQAKKTKKTVKNMKPVKTLKQLKTTSTAKAQTIVKAEQMASKSESSAGGHQTKSDGGEKQKQPIKKIKTQKASVLMKKGKSSTNTPHSRTNPKNAKQENKPLIKDKERNPSSERFGELDFSTGDFVTVDEINEDMVDTAVEDPSFLSKPTSKEKKAGSSAAHSGVRKILSSSKSAKGNQSVSINTKTKGSSKLKKCESYATVHKTSPSFRILKSIKTPSSHCQKVQSVKKKPLIRSSEPSSSVVSKCSSVTAMKTSLKNQRVHQKHTKPADSKVEKPEHKGSAENFAANNVIPESTSDASTEMDISAKGQILETENLEKDLKDETIKEMNKSKAKENDTNGTSTEESGSDVKKQVLESLIKKADEQHNEENQEKRTEDVQESLTTKGGRPSARGDKTDEKTSVPVEEPKTSEKVEEIFTVLDSVEDESPNDQPVTTTSTRGRKENATEKVEENTKTRDDETPTSRRTPSRDFKDKSPKIDAGVSLSESTQGKGKLGKDNQTSKDQTKREDEPDYQIVNDVGEDKFVENKPLATSLEKESDTKDKVAANFNIGLSGSSTENKEDETTERSVLENKSTIYKADTMKEDKSSLNKPNANINELEKRNELPKTNKRAEKGALSNLDQVSSEEEDYADDTFEELKLKKRQVAAMETKNKQKDKTFMERETMEQQSVEHLKPESLQALEEAGREKAEEADDEETIQMSSSSKRKHSENEAVEEQNRELTRPEAKRTRPHSPCVAPDLQLPPFNPKNPLGEEFVVPKTGFFCNLCSMFYLNENSAKKIHCSSQKHYDNLVRHYQKLKQETSGTTSQSVQD